MSGQTSRLAVKLLEQALFEKDGAVSDIGEDLKVKSAADSGADIFLRAVIQ